MKGGAQGKNNNQEIYAGPAKIPTRAAGYVTAVFYLKEKI
jgi:hypothetical protein